MYNNATHPTQYKHDATHMSYTPHTSYTLVLSPTMAVMIAHNQQPAATTWVRSYLSPNTPLIGEHIA